MTSNPLVSILINNYNYGEFLENAIKSALEQTYANVEVIVVDDGSTDNSREVVKPYEPIVKLIAKENGGQASAFNAGFAASTGEIICFLDSDDYFLSNKAERIVDLFEQHQDISWCFHPLKLIDKENCPIEAHVPVIAAYYDYRKSAKRGKLPFIPTATSGLCFRRSLLEQILPMPEGTTVTLSDNYIKFIASFLSKAFISADYLAIQKIHGGNAYTLSPHKRALKTKIHILTAYWIRTNFPALYKLADNLLAKEMELGGQYIREDALLKSTIQQYFAISTPLQQIKIRLHITYLLIKATLRNFWKRSKSR